MPAFFLRASRHRLSASDVLLERALNGRKAPEIRFTTALRRPVWRREVAALNHYVQGATAGASGVAAAAAKRLTDPTSADQRVEFVH